MNAPNKSTLARLHFEQVSPTMVEGDNDLLLEAGDGIEEFKFPGTENLNPLELNKWVIDRLEVIFDGDLDDPDKFTSIVCVGIADFAEGDTRYDDDLGLILSGLDIYLKVDSSLEELEEDDLNDIFHAIVFLVRDVRTEMRFTEFEEYSAESIPAIKGQFKDCNFELLI